MAEGLWNAAGLGDAFRKNVASDIPTLLVHGTWDTSTPIENALDTRRSRNGRRPLNWAAFYNHVEVIEVLLEYGADINGTNLTGFTPVHHAAENNSSRSASILVEAGADADIPNRRGKKPLDTAREKGHEELVRLLENRP
jgi:hypothetical protein